MCEGTNLCYLNITLNKDLYIATYIIKVDLSPINI